MRSDRPMLQPSLPRQQRLGHGAAAAAAAAASSAQVGVDAAPLAVAGVAVGVGWSPAAALRKGANAALALQALQVRAHPMAVVIGSTASGSGSSAAASASASALMPVGRAGASGAGTGGGGVYSKVKPLDVAVESLDAHRLGDHHRDHRDHLLGHHYRDRDRGSGPGRDYHRHGDGHSHTGGNIVWDSLDDGGFTGAVGVSPAVSRSPPGHGVTVAPSRSASTSAGAYSDYGGGVPVVQVVVPSSVAYGRSSSSPAAKDRHGGSHSGAGGPGAGAGHAGHPSRDTASVGRSTGSHGQGGAAVGSTSPPGYHVSGVVAGRGSFSPTLPAAACTTAWGTSSEGPRASGATATSHGTSYTDPRRSGAGRSGHGAIDSGASSFQLKLRATVGCVSRVLSAVRGVLTTHCKRGPRSPLERALRDDRYPVTRPLVAGLVAGLRLTPLSVLQLRKTFLRQVAIQQVDAPADDSHPEQSHPFVATVSGILEWVGMAPTPFLEHMLLRLLRYSMDLPPLGLQRLQLPKVVPRGGNKVLQRQHDVTSFPLDFQSFLYVVCTFCAMSGFDVHRFVFDLVDANGDDELSPQEIEFLIVAVNNGVPQFGSQKDNKDAHSLISLFDKNADGRLQFNEFEAMGRKNRSLLWPVMHLQDALRTATFGQKAWEAMLSAQAASIRL